jgi:hypothetical protein
MSPPADPDDLTPSQGLAHLAEVLARGLARGRARPALDAAESTPEKLSESRPGGLEVAADLRLTVHTGLREPVSQPRSE